MSSRIQRVLVCAIVGLAGAATQAGAQVLRVADLNAPQLRALDRSKTVVVLTGEEVA